MVWTYHSVEELKEKFNNGEDVSVEEKRKLEKYIRQKKKLADHPQGEWSKKQLLNAEFLFQKIQNQEQTVEVET